MSGPGERVLPWNLPGLLRVRRWQQGHTGHHAARHVALGRLPDGQWVAEHTDLTIGSYTHPTRKTAEQQLTEWMREGKWQEVPAAYGADGQPIGDGWVRRGSQWVRG